MAHGAAPPAASPAAAAGAQPPSQSASAAPGSPRACYSCAGDSEPAPPAGGHPPLGGAKMSPSFIPCGRVPTTAERSVHLRGTRSVRSTAFQSCASDGGQEDDAESDAGCLVTHGSTRAACPAAAQWASQQSANPSPAASPPPGARPRRGGGVPLCFRGLSTWDRHQGRQLLRGVCGLARPGELTAVLGSDERCTDALVAVLGGEASASAYRGVLRAGGVPARGPGSHYVRVVGHVAQQPVCLSRHLSVLTNLRMTVRLLLREREAAEWDERVERVLQQCELQPHTGRRVCDLEPDAMRRLALAIELLTDPPVLIVEDLTKSLGVSASLAVVRLLRGLAHERGKTVVVSLRQPRWAVYSLVDRLLLLHGNELAYLGPAGEDAMVFFQERGWVWDRQYTPTDFLLQLCEPQQDALRRTAEGQRRGESDEDNLRVSAVPGGVDATTLAQVFANSPQYEAELRPELDALLANTALAAPEPRSAPPSELSRLLILLRVILLQAAAWWKWYALRFGAVLAIASIAGRLYESQEISQRGMQNRVGISFFILSILMLANMPLASGLIEHRAVYLKQRASGYYHFATYWAMIVLWELILVRGVCTVLFAVLVFYLTRFDSPSDVGSFVGILTITQMTFAALALLVGSWAPNESTSVTVLFSLCAFFTLSGGLIVNLTSVPNWLVWVEHLSILHYGYESMLTNMFQNRTFDCYPYNPNETGFNDGCYTGDGYLDLLGFKAAHKWKNMYILTGMWVLLLFIALVGLARQRQSIAAEPSGNLGVLPSLLRRLNRP
eukprot:TRINITY_DN65035_c0_g1_i1.p1 TRINITY_DN65035_c0_g1~~TRINITY_DN65035_c0_g1_i1.p1  ORF type:complete len:808 (+),score=214.22 TRINITY_DN65035_c0_g1_i1:73-2424(+)